MRAPVLFAVLFVWALSTSAAAAVPGPWAVLADRDLQAVHDILRDNHPGAVDEGNPGYALWLEDGLVEARREAATASTYSDYRRSLQRYVNGFRDGHTYLSGLPSHGSVLWPGIAVGGGPDGTIRVTGTADPPVVPVGALLVSCDGADAETMMRRRVDPYHFNPDLPHRRRLLTPLILQVQIDEADRTPRECTFQVEGRSMTATLEWRPINRSALDRFSVAQERPPLAIRKIEDVWLVSIPSFMHAGDTAQLMHDFIAELGDKAPEMRAGRVVFDLRGNSGGNSGWGNRIATAFWSDQWVRRINDSLDNRFDARVSTANLRHVRTGAAQHRRDGINFGWDGMAALMEQALAHGQPYVRIGNPPTGPAGPPPPSPVTGQVYLLTDEACASACLNFADLLVRLPGVVHIGLPTSADAIYIDNTEALLPSGLGSLSYSFKAYRGRVRANNQFYEPTIPWPGGAMTDAAIVAWVRTLSP